jgi:anti-sigma factor RsiW
MHRIDLRPNVGEDDLHAFVDGQLPAERHHEVMAYLAVHPDAADRISVLLRQRVEMAALRERLNDSEPEAELAVLEHALCRVVRRQRRVSRVLGAGSVAAALLFTVTTAGWWITGGQGERAAGARQVAEASTEARTASWRQVTAGADSAVAADASDSAILWLQAHLSGRALKQPDLEKLGLRFVGSAPLKGAFGPAIRLVYADDAGSKFDFFVGVRQSGVELAASLVPDGHISLSWQDDPLVFTLVAPQGSARLGEIMRSATSLLDPAPVAADTALAGPDNDGARSGTVGPGPVVSTDDGGPRGADVAIGVPRTAVIPMPKPEFSKPL